MGLYRRLGAAVAALAMLSACSDDRSRSRESVGEAEVELTNAPSDVKCLRLTIDGPSRSDVRKFPLVTGQRAVFRLSGLPVGDDTFTAHAFAAKCENLNAGATATWYSEPVVARIRAGLVTHVAIKMIHNGGASVGVDFDDKNGPSGQGEPPLEGGTHSSDEPYLSPVGCPVEPRAVLTVGDSPNLRPDGSRYRLAGIPDGLGAFDNGDGTFTLLVNHGLGVDTGIARAHGAKGAFVSKWTIRRADLAVMNGSDLIELVAVWNPKTSAYEPPTKGIAFGRFSSADLPNPSALFDAATGLGFDGHLFFNGEAIGDEGRAWAHGIDGTSSEFARMGKASWENVVPNPGTGEQTVVIGMDGSGGGQLYVYVGKKTRDGSPVQRAGLTNGALHGLVVPGFPVEPASGIPAAPFELHSFGNVENRTGAELQAESARALVTGFQRPEDGAWDPNNPNDFYFVTTAAFELPSRLFRLRFNDVRNAAQGGRIEMLLDGTEGQRMLDNVTVDTSGHVYLQEDPGNNVRLAKIWRYDIATDQLSEVSEHAPERFAPGGAGFLTQDEESSGIIDVSGILGPGTFIMTTQVHLANQDPELVEGGQLSFMRDNDGLGGIMAAIATLMVECTGKIGPDSFVLDQDGMLALPENLDECPLPEPDPPRDDVAEDDRIGAMRAYLSLQMLMPDGSPRKTVPNARQCIGGRWAAWRQAFARTGITQEQCPAWNRLGILDDTEERFQERLRIVEQRKPIVVRDANGAIIPGTFTAEPPNLELFKFNREFAVGFDQGEPMHPCIQEGPGACAALCAGAFPGFVLGAEGTNVTVDAMEWLEHRAYLNPRNDPWLKPGYYHPTWAYYYGPSVGSRMRANNCNAAPDKLKSLCGEEVRDIEPPTASSANPLPYIGQQRSCSARADPALGLMNENCAAESCTLFVADGIFQEARYTLDCIEPIEGALDKADVWNTCVAHCSAAGLL
jgi:hypothetical protein